MRAVIVVIATAAAFVIVNGGTAQAEVCPEVISIAVDGTNSVNQPNSIAGLHAPDAIHVQYPGSIWPLGPYSYDQSVAMGVAETKRVVREQHSRCPASTIRVVGHSQGSRVAGDAIEQLAAEGDTSYIHGDLYSDPRHVGTGIEIMVPLGLPGNRFMGERSGFGNADVNQVCITGDPICNFPNLVAEPVKALDVIPGYINLHGAYPVGVTNEVTAAPAPPPVVILPETPPIPPLPNIVEPYTPRPISTYIPVEVQVVLPREVLDWTPPPLPALPALPPLPALQPLPPLPF